MIGLPHDDMRMDNRRTIIITIFMLSAAALIFYLM